MLPGLTHFAVLAGLALTTRTSVLVPVSTLALSAASAWLYAADKSAARRGTWRISESTLHLVDMLGGWPGGLVARHALQHKTRKQPFRAVFWGTVIVNLAVLTLMLLGGPELLDLLAS